MAETDFHGRTAPFESAHFIRNATDSSRTSADIADSGANSSVRDLLQGQSAASNAVNAAIQLLDAKNDARFGELRSGQQHLETRLRMGEDRAAAETRSLSEKVSALQSGDIQRQLGVAQLGGPQAHLGYGFNGGCYNGFQGQFNQGCYGGYQQPFYNGGGWPQAVTMFQPVNACPEPAKK